MSERTGGCQCGKIRYRIIGPVFDAHLCHCRMCQRAVGNLFASLVSVKREHIDWPKGEPAKFRSSSVIRRGFCPDCGTPLTYDNVESPHLSIAIGSLDDPAQVPPLKQYGAEGRLPYVPYLHELPSSRTEDDVPPEVLVKFKSWQFQP